MAGSPQKSDTQSNEKIIADEDKGEGLQSTVRLLYNSSRVRMFHVADRMMAGMIEEVKDLHSKVKEPELLQNNVWDFQLGDIVTTIKSREDFKWMLKKTVGWNEKLNHIHGRVGIVNKVYSKYDCKIGVYFPNEYAGCTLYAGVLKKVIEEEKKNEIPTPASRWKVGSYVEIMPSVKTVKIIQWGLDQLPEKLIGMKGRVIAVTHPCVLVTFDEMTTCDIKSASLIQWEDRLSFKENVEHPRGFKVGDVVKIISSVEKLIENQKCHGGWDPPMCSMIGKQATIVCIKESGSLVLRTEYCKQWEINPNSVLRLEEEEIEKGYLEFAPGDNVKVDIPNDIRFEEGIPPVFLEFLQAIAIVSFVDADLNYYIRFNADQHVQIDKKLLRKASQSEIKKYESIEKRVKELKAGDEVCLDVGPTKYVEEMIKDLKLDAKVANAMVKPAKLIDINPHSAVIQYENDTRFCVKRKFLTVPEKFHLSVPRNGISPMVISCIYDKICQSVMTIHEESRAMAEDWKVDAASVCYGSPSCIVFKIESKDASFEAVLDKMKENLEWEVESSTGRQLLLRNVDASCKEIKVELVFSKATPAQPTVPDHDNQRQHSNIINIYGGTNNTAIIKGVTVN